MSHSHRDVGRFDQWATTYDRSYLQRRVFEPVQRTLLDMAVAEKPDAAAILDVGCGTGRLLRAARSRFPEARLEGVDAAPGMIARAQAEGGARMTLLTRELYEVAMGVRMRRPVAGLVGQVSVLQINRI